MRLGYFLVVFRVVVRVYLRVRVWFIVQVFDRRVVDGLRYFVVLIKTTVMIGRVYRRVLVFERLGGAFLRFFCPFDDVAFDFMDVYRRLRYGLTVFFIFRDVLDVFRSDVFIACSVYDRDNVVYCL